MLFNSLEYFLFFGFVFFYRWYIHPFFFAEGQKSRDILHFFLLIASYLFYMSWDYRFGGLIFLSTIIDYYLAIKISSTENEKKRLWLLRLSLFLNLVAILGFFKYYNFFAETVQYFFSGKEILPKLNIILPVGISFFTFQSMSYTIDVYRRQIDCEKSFVRFALFVSFFPQLVAGPIVTAKTFIHQLYKDVQLEEIPFKLAIRFFFLGYFKKVILSDNISPIVDLVYDNPANFGSASIFFAAVLFLAQIYCDFSGYSDMAYGSALLLGYELPENFRMSLIRQSFSDFWRYWHMTLSGWLRDYVYFSLGGSKTGYIRHKFNLFFTMLLAGIWHGANWTYVVWGICLGCILIIETLYKDLIKKYFPNKEETSSNIFITLASIFLTNMLVTLTTVIFRSKSLSHAYSIFYNMFSFTDKEFIPWTLKVGLTSLIILYLGQWIGYQIFEKNKTFRVPIALEFSLYIPLVLVISYLTNDNNVPFIYFQF
ncbi:MAG: MBOAT family O-acyltransferase [Leptospiraceae bacterium]|nr:MBOAT family O-acyltransferase [Leptospiraceae bacterium]